MDLVLPMFIRLFIFILIQRHRDLRLSLSQNTLANPVGDPSLLLFGKRGCKLVDGVPSATDTRGRQQVNSRVTIISNVEILSFIGEGRYTEVAKGHLDDRIGNVAVKRLKTPAKDNTLDNKLQFLLNAVHTASFWSHSSIVRIFSISLSPQFSACFELCASGPLDIYLNNHSEVSQEKLSISDLVVICETIAQALHYISESSMTGCTDVHGAICARNVLVYGAPRCHRTGPPIVKLADAGLAAYYNTLDTYDSPENRERFAWLAPENYDNLSSITTYSDVYSFGILLWEVFSYGQRPFANLDPATVMRNSILSKPDCCPECLYHLIARCCNCSPAFRPTTHAIIKELFKALTEGLSSPPAFPPSICCYTKLNDRSHYTVPSWNESLQTSNCSDDTLTSEPHTSSVQSSCSWVTDDSQTPLINCSRNCEPEKMPADSEALLFPIPNEELKKNDLSYFEEWQRNGHSLMQKRPLPDVPPKPICSGPELKQWQVLNTLKKLGKGYYGIVYRGEFKKTSTSIIRPVAIKCLHAKMYEECAGAFEREIKVMLTLKHENIVEIIGYLPQRNAEHPMQLIMEFVENGSLCQYIKQLKPKSNDASKVSKALVHTMLRYAREIAEGIHYLHSEGIIHRDLASRNILVTGTSESLPSQVHMKISDFGLARVLDPNAEYYKSDNSKVIPAPWCAPESLCNFQFRKEGDVWSFAITVWEIFSYGDTPILCKIDEMANRLHKGDRLRRPPICPVEIYSLILKCWEYYPLNRITFPNILHCIAQLETLTFQ